MHEEKRRLDEAGDWRDWGPYVSDRSWGSVREDYSADGDAWAYFPFDHAHSRAYRWGEDAMAGVCDLRQTWAFGLSLWNGVDPILKERAFGLSGPEGNHGEDVKDYWWYLDNTPTHSHMRWRYHYPQQEFPYARLRSENAHRGRSDPEFELLDTGIFDEDRYWAVDVEYAKAGPHDLVIKISARNAGPDDASIELLPTLWFRNTWAWGNHPDAAPHTLSAAAQGLTSSTGLTLSVVDGSFESLFCDNETNAAKLFPGAINRSAYPKDGINDHVVHGAATVNPAQTGSKAALRFKLDVPAGETQTVVLRLCEGDPAPAEASDILADRLAEADEFHASLAPQGIDADTALILRQAIAGMLWSKQFYRYEVQRWLDGDSSGPQPPAERLTGRNADWRNLDARDVISMPDTWEYPWFAAWDLAFHCVVLACVDPEFAKAQLLLLLREWYMHPSGQLPAYEWKFSDVNPPVHAWAALEIFRRDGSRDVDFLERVFHKLCLNFTWWTNRKDVDGNNLYSGGFLGLDNIGPIDRSSLPDGMVLEQSDGTAWMAAYCLSMLEIAIELTSHDPTYEQMATKFFEHFALIASALDSLGLWDEQDGFYYDVLKTQDGDTVPLRVRSMVGLMPLSAVLVLTDETLAKMPEFAEHVRWFVAHRKQYDGVIGEVKPGARLMSVVSGERLERLVERLSDPAEFASDHGLRSLSKAHGAAPYTLELPGLTAEIGYVPAESDSWLYGGNSNWRGPVWLPVNYLMTQALRRHGEFHADTKLGSLADTVDDQLIGLFRLTNGERPADGGTRWKDVITFYEYFHGDTGKGLGASHQTGWTGLVIPLILDGES